MCASVRPSVTFVDQDHIRCKSWKIIARTITPTPLLFVAQKPSTYFQGNMGKSEETRDESLGKVVCRSTKATMSLKRVRIEEKLLPRELINAFSNGSIAIPYDLLFLKILLCNPHPKPQSITIRPISGAGKGTNFN